MAKHYSDNLQAQRRAELAVDQSNYRDYELGALAVFRAGRDAELDALRKELTTVGHSDELNALRAQLANVNASLDKAMADLGPATPAGVLSPPTWHQPNPPTNPPVFVQPTDPLPGQNVNVGTHGELGTAGLPNLPNPTFPDRMAVSFDPPPLPPARRKP